MNKVDHIVAELVEAQSENAELRKKLAAFMALHPLVPCPPEVTPDELAERLRKFLTLRPKHERAARCWWMVRAVAREIDYRRRAAENYPDRKLDSPPLTDENQLAQLSHWLFHFYGKDYSGVRKAVLRRLDDDPEIKELM